jgi:hypothetical protein
MKHLVWFFPVVVAFALMVLLIQSRQETAIARKALSVAEAEVQRLSGALDQARPTEPVSDISHSITPAPAPKPEMPAWTSAEPAPLQVQTVLVGSAEAPPMTEDMASAIDRFDVAMDQQFNRLESREQAATDPEEVATIERIKAKLENLDALYRRADTATNTDERIAIRQEMQSEMGSIIGLSRVDRNERIAKLATDIGYSDPQAVQQFVQEIDRIYYETHLDWAKLFNRAPPE